MTTLKILRRARALLDELGWCQLANWRDMNGIPTDQSIDAYACCANGAIDLAISGRGPGIVDGSWFYETSPKSIPSIPPHEQLDLNYEAKKILRGQIEPPFNSIAVWNDDPCRTKEEVLAAFDRAIEAARRRKQTDDDGRRE